jgi:hypothetical protein
MMEFEGRVLINMSNLCKEIVPGENPDKEALTMDPKIDSIDELISLWSFRHTAGSTLAQAWEQGARKGWSWAINHWKHRFTLKQESIEKRLKECEDKVKVDLAQANGMAESMDLLREDLIQLGVIDHTVPPMFMTEAVVKALHKAYNQGKNGEELCFKSSPTQPGSGGY